MRIGSAHLLEKKARPGRRLEMRVRALQYAECCTNCRDAAFGEQEQDGFVVFADS
jgi:hypothetical protein